MIRSARWVEMLVFVAGCLACATRADLLPGMTNGVPGEFAPRRAGAEANAIYRVGVTQEGLYRIAVSNLFAAGLTNATGDSLRMFCRTQEVALLVSSTGMLASTDTILFYGWGHDGLYSLTNVFWIGTGSVGLRMESRDGGLKGGGVDVAACTETVKYDPKSLYRPFYRPADATLDHWFAAVIFTNTATSVTVQTDARLVVGSATLRVKLAGLSSEASINPDHRTEVSVNAVVVASILFDGEQLLESNVPFANSLLADGATTVSFKQNQVGVTFDAAYLREFSIDYGRWLVARNNALKFHSLAGTANFLTAGFTGDTGVRVFDVTDRTRPIVVTNFVRDFTNGSYRVRFGDLIAASNDYYITRNIVVPALSNVEKVQFRGLASTNRQADFVAICQPERRLSTFRLLQHRYVNGLQVAVAPIDEIYNEFSYGIRDAAAIKQFLGYAFHHWKGPPPRYAVLLGEGSYDPMNKLGVADPSDVIPVHLGPSVYEWTSQDNWYATVNGSDLLVDMAIGRIPTVGGTSQGGVVTKIINYEATTAGATWRKKALLVADKFDGVLDFKGASEVNVNAHLSSNGFSRTSAYLDDMSPASAVNTIIAQFNSGVFTVSYFGHGSIVQWADENIFTTSSVAGLFNTVHPIVAVMTCDNGNFDEPGKECLAEALVEKPDGGSIATIAGSAVSVQAAAEYFAYGFYGALVKTNQYKRLGDVMNAGLMKLWTVAPAQPELLHYNIFGDPALLVNP